MINNNISPYCQNKSIHTYDIVSGLRVTVTVQENPYHVSLDSLFSMGARINPKRSFLFVSKVLGKHIPVDPHVSMLSGAILSLMLLRECDEANCERVESLLVAAMRGLTSPHLAKQAYADILKRSFRLPFPVRFIGFAETATALGHSMYNVFNGDCTYIHTTREHIPSKRSVINFEEEHSHAVSHRCYALDPKCIEGTDPIILVDDEITTGKTVLNLIRDIQSQYPRQSYYVASLLDWRTGEDEAAYAALEIELGITIKSVYLIKGTIEVSSTIQLPSQLEETLKPYNKPEIQYHYLNNCFEQVQGESENSLGCVNSAPYLMGTGRFGLHQEQNQFIDRAVTEAANCLIRHRDEKTLCLGTGEFMYIPMRIAAEMGENVAYHSSTRSPVYSELSGDYAIKHKLSFSSPEDPQVVNYFYNIAPGKYDDLFLFMERDLREKDIEPMLNALYQKNFKKINLVVCGPKIHK